MHFSPNYVRGSVTYSIEDILVLVYLLGTPELVGRKEEVIFMYKYEL
jgi:hypothetical protein